MANRRTNRRRCRSMPNPATRRRRRHDRRPVTGPAYSMVAQLPLDLGHRPALEREDFLVAECNAAAVAWVDRWPGWPGGGLAIHGPAGGGKTRSVKHTSELQSHMHTYAAVICMTT